MRSGESSLHDRAGRTAEHVQIVGATGKGTPPTGQEQAAAAAGSLSRWGRARGRTGEGWVLPDVDQRHTSAAGQFSANLR